LSSTINILLTGGGAPGAPGILHCLEQDPSITVTVVDANANAVGRYLNKDFQQIPLATDPQFVDALLSVCRNRDIHAVLPLVTKELIPLATRANEFELAGAKLLVSPVESLVIANNKSQLYEFLQWRGMEVPAYKIVETIDQFNDAVNELNYPAKNICFKPSVSNGSRGFRIIANDINEADLLFNHKPNSVYISLADAQRILSSSHFPQLLISEYLPGDEYSVDCLANHGEAVLVIPRLRKRMINGISVEGEFIKNDPILAYCAQIIHELRLHGNIGIQVKANAEGKYLILEINPRVQGTISAALGAGVNLPLLAIKQELGLAIKTEDVNVKWGTKFSRYWQETFY
jgi:carbamoyl-phosphate synthase large subunit